MGAGIVFSAASATQDIVIDAFRIESLNENEQAAGMASYVAAYRVGMLVSSAGALGHWPRLRHRQQAATAGRSAPSLRPT